MPATPNPILKGEAFYLHALDLLDASGVDYLIGGAFAMARYTGIDRDTKDLDCMLRCKDVDAVLAVFRKRGFRADYVFPHWLAKIHHGAHYIDLIYRAGNGLCPVDDEWFAHARTATVFGREVRICPPEEIIWQKAYIMERERFDGADVIHIIRGWGRKLDWKRLLARFGEDWRVLLSHMILFGFAYPGEREKIPAEVMAELYSRLAFENEQPPKDSKVCPGTLLSRAQYLPAIEHWGYKDARLSGRSTLTEEQLRLWTEAIDPEHRPN
jgi:hypothetical protein